MSHQHFDFFVVGGGSGGIAAARRAATYNVKVGIAEDKRWGGTCVNVGCVPKKIMWWASNVRHILDESKHYGFTEAAPRQFSWPYLKQRRDANIARLNTIYATNLEKSGIAQFNATASFSVPSSLPISDGPINLDLSDGTHITAKHVLVATGGKSAELNIPGIELAINSDGFFDLEELPKSAAVIGAGYIAVELAGVLQGLGCRTELFVRGNTALRYFDPMIATKLHQEMLSSGIAVHPGSVPKAFRKQTDGGLTVDLMNGESHEGFEVIIVAIGRSPFHSTLKVDNIGMERSARDYIIVDEFQQTSVARVYAVGDVTGKIELTPVAIAAGRRLADRLFSGSMPDAKIDYNLVPTVIFSHPPIGTVGMSETEATDKYGKEDVEIYTNVAVNLYYNVFDMPPESKPRTHIKMICVKSLGYLIVGLHMIGMNVDEILQGFGVALKMGATKYDFDNCIAIHPSAAEEVVTMKWGLV